MKESFAALLGHQDLFVQHLDSTRLIFCGGIILFTSPGEPCLPSSKSVLETYVQYDLGSSGVQL